MAKPLSHQYKVPEILAPVGSTEAFYSAIANGCDALYLSGRFFGARAFANNFDTEELEILVKYAHLHKVNVYYTLNTIVKDIEINKLKEELEFLRKIHIDAVILQDLGVYEYIKNNFPDLCIHGSTQMNLHSLEDAKRARAMGFDRIVLSRECSLKDISKIKEEVDIEIEAFVHGALCYCYSGQCLMSSIYGGRSGNRGKCAQPCRMAYNVEGQSQYYLSPKDQMTLEILPELIKSGIDSFKIEGRMKSSQYVGLATKLYKKYRDLSLLLLDQGKEETYKVDSKDIEELNQLYNRGHFTKGYYQQHNNNQMISLDHSKNYGIKIGTVTYSKNGYQFQLFKDTLKEDLFEVHTDIDLSKGEQWPDIRLDQDQRSGSFKVNQLFTSEQKRVDSRQFTIGKSYDVFRLRDTKLLGKIDKSYEPITLISIKGSLNGVKGQPLSLNITYEAAQENDKPAIQIQVQGDMVQQAKNRPTEEKDFLKQLNKTKDSGFVFEAMKIQIEDDIFVPLGSINELRRQGIEQLEKALLEAYDNEWLLMGHSLEKRIISDLIEEQKSQNNVLTVEAENTNQSAHSYTLALKNLSQMKVIYDFLIKSGTLKKKIRRIYVDSIDLSVDEMKEVTKLVHELKLECYMMMPHVEFNDYHEAYFNKLKQLNQDCIDGFLIRTLGQIEMCDYFKKPFITDYNLHSFNSEAVKALYELGALKTTLSVELNEQGLLGIMKNYPNQVETLVYGSIALMHSANCIYQTRHGRCNKRSEGHNLTLEDRKGIRQQVLCHCQMCYNSIYNTTPLYLLDEKDKLQGDLRLEFSFEQDHELLDILKTLENNSTNFDQIRHTRGHFRRGVK